MSPEPLAIQARGLRRRFREGAREHIVELVKPKRKPDWMAQADYDQAPQTLKVRELYTGGKLLVTTLLCPAQTPKAALKARKRLGNCRVDPSLLGRRFLNSAAAGRAAPAPI